MQDTAQVAIRPEGFGRVARALAELEHVHAPAWLDFDEIWAAAGHPHGVFRLAPQQLVQDTGAPVADVADLSPAA